MPKSSDRCDVLIMGGHPCAYLAGALLRNKSSLRIVHVALPGEQLCERLVAINPALFDLHKLLAPLERKLNLFDVYGLHFLSNEANLASEYRTRGVAAHVTPLGEVRDALVRLALEQGVETSAPASIDIDTPDSDGVRVEIDGKSLRARSLVVAGRLPREQEKLLGLPVSWGEGIVHRHTFARVANCAVESDKHPTIPMSLDLAGSLAWAWMLPAENEAQLCISQPIESVQKHPSHTLMAQWANVLLKHKICSKPLDLDAVEVQSMDLPLAGALAQDGVADRTLLIGPAGGFFSACTEDIYPNCWSALFAANVLKKALKETHLQDALNAYRSEWRTTLGDYLRGPQQNLRFLLPLVYRNQVMTNRLGEAILMGKSVVR